MPAIDCKLRSQLDTVCQEAREKAEEAARSALVKRAVDVAEPHAHFKLAEKMMRNRLRARGRQAGDLRLANKTQTIDQLTQELAYEYWHRMLFARFLAENHLLMHPDGVAVSLEECEELAADEGAPNGFMLAARYASKMLPQVFRTDDVLLEIEFAPEHRLALEKLLAKLPRETFLADDSLGWVYQFWQTARKKAVNESGNKIDSRTISSVTQLFTEDYMVQFLLHNTLGAWWCAKEGITGQGAGNGSDKCPVALEYLRWRDDGSLAAGKFDGWPKTLKEFTLLDPCCGSGHFLVAAFNLLVPLRMHDEGLSAREACDAVLRENLYGLELDPRCTQIAAFALAVAAWKYPGEDGQPLGYRDDLPALNIACAGIGPQASEEEWLKLAEQSGVKMNVLSREPIMNGLRNLHALFSNAPTLGSLIDPNQLSADLITADYETLKPYLSAALKAEQSDDDAHERAVAAAGMVKAAELLAGEYTLVITNVPYLGRGKQDDVLRDHLDEHFPNSRADLATSFVERSLEFCAKHGTTALVTPQNWLYLKGYRDLREPLLKERTWNLVARLGTKGFQTPMWDFNIQLGVISATRPSDTTTMAGIDVSSAKQPAEKAALLSSEQTAAIAVVSQSDQLENPDCAIAFKETSSSELLNQFCDSFQGLCTSDDPQFIFEFWELSHVTAAWKWLQSSASSSGLVGGSSSVLYWENGEGRYYRHAMALKAEKRLGGWKSGQSAWGRIGIAINVTQNFFVTTYSREWFDNTIAAVIPTKDEFLAPIFAFVSSSEYRDALREQDQSLSITEHTLLKVPFDLAYWQQMAAEKYPKGLPDPESDDPTQWLFHGRPESSTAPLQIAVARLLGYRWPAELDQKIRLSQRARDLVQRCEELLQLADRDGLVPLPSVRGESPAAERLMDVLQAAYGSKWSTSVLHALLTEAGCQSGKTLDDWLRDAFFEQHCKLFGNRPFIWHIWDGRKDGFACLVNYHQFNHKALENLTYSYLQDWIKVQADQAKTGKTGADLRLAAAQALQDKLKLILAGEPPYDIFVRWKPLHEQSIGWNPDLNDGVRQNIRPFIEAGILRKEPKSLLKNKDRGKEPQREKADFPWFWSGNTFVGDRVNYIHLTNAEKHAARSRKKGVK
ncbi:MAG: SAM-dependent DNA methyltransferase [Planctomycetes bacterium]|nr:SAM-dependent DNA methyltransferase [Planctomycetota bacterium]